MKQRNSTSILLLAAVALAFTAASCGAGKNDTGRIFMPDMTYSNAYEAYSENRLGDEINNEVSSVASARQPDSRSIPHGYLPADAADRQNEAFMKSWAFKNHYANWNFDPDNYQALYDAAGSEVQNPLEYNETNLAAGKAVYTIQCAVCHGEKGAGDGSIVIEKDDKGNEIGDGPYTAIPPAYTDRLPGLTDGNIFYSVTYGKNMMGGYAHALNVEERWQVVMYIKELAGMNGGGAPAPAPVQEADGEEMATEDMPDMASN